MGLELMGLMKGSTMMKKLFITLLVLLNLFGCQNNNNDNGNQDGDALGTPDQQVDENTDTSKWR